MSGDPEQEYFSDGITEDIITDLSKVGGLMVIARNSSFAYKGKNVDIRTVGRELGVRSVLEGSIRRAGNRVRITAQLIDAANGAHLWAERYDRDLTDIFAVQDEVTREIVEALKVTLTPAEKKRLADSETSNVAHDCVLRGRELMLGKEKNSERSSRRSNTSRTRSRSIPTTRSPMPVSASATCSTTTIAGPTIPTRRCPSPEDLPIRRLRKIRTSRWHDTSRRWRHLRKRISTEPKPRSKSR